MSDVSVFKSAERQADTRAGLPFRAVMFSLVFIIVFISSLVIAEKAQDDLDYWMRRATPVAESQPGTDAPPVSVTTKPADTQPARRDDALPGVIELSDGTQLAGWMYGTKGEPWLVWVAAEKRWRRIPPAAVLSITAVVDQEEMKLRWRWKGMGQPEKVFTGKSYPFRRFRWRFTLADGSDITGVVKGQPLWIETKTASAPQGPFLLQERAKGKDGQSLAKLIYVRKIVISRRMKRNVEASQTGGLGKKSNGGLTPTAR